MNYIDSTVRIFRMYKQLGEKAMAQVTDEDLNWSANTESNSIAVIVKHLWGNMLSRWTDFLTTDGEKPWRQRDAEFDNDLNTRTAVMQKWEEGWQCVFTTLSGLTDGDLDKTVYIRNEGQSVSDAISRQIAHYAYHVGQIVYISKLRNTTGWESLSIPRNKSAEYNARMFAQEKENKHFTEGLLDTK